MWIPTCPSPGASIWSSISAAHIAPSAAPRSLRGMTSEPVSPATYDEEIIGAEKPVVQTTQTDAERLARVQRELSTGFAALAGVAPAVSVFGSARTPEGDRHYE